MLRMQILRQTRGAMELLDVSGELEGLKRLPGVRKWLVRDRAMLRPAYKQVSRLLGQCLEAAYKQSC